MADSIIKAIEFPGRVFKSREELFSALKANESKFITLKTARLYEGRQKEQFTFLNAEKFAVEAAKTAGFTTKSDCIYPIISTTRYRDSHKDVHFDGCFTKTVKEQQGRVMYALDHKVEFDQIIAWPKDVKMFVASIAWSMVGKSYEGSTEALIFEIEKAAITRPEVLATIEANKMEFENSIRMRYFMVKMGIDSKQKELKENKAYYDSRIEQIANKEAVKEDGYFWGVEELGIHKEGSLVVAGGSNDATSIYIPQDNGAGKSTLEEAPLTSTQKSRRR